MQHTHTHTHTHTHKHDKSNFIHDIDDGFGYFISFITIVVLRIPNQHFFDLGQYWLCEACSLYN